jgi:hypothetical protein
VLIQDSEFAGPDSNGTQAAIRGHGWSLLRVNIHGYTDGVRTDGNDSLVDCYLHDFRILSPDAHADAASALGSIENVSIKHNTFLFDVDQRATAIIQLGTEYGGNNDVTVDGNYLRGANAVTFYPGLYKQGGVTKFAPDMHGMPTTSGNIRFINNTIVATSKSIVHYDAWIMNHGFEWYGNVKAENGQAIPPPETGTLP